MMTEEDRRAYFGSLGWSLCGVLVYLLFHRFQPVIQLNQGQGWDGTQYAGMFNYFRHGTFSSAVSGGPIFPFNQRPLVPFLAALLSAHLRLSPIQSFKTLHIMSAAITSGLLYLIFVKYLRVDKLISCVALIWLLFHALSYTRITNFYPFMVDDIAALTLTLLLYIVLSGRYAWLPVLAIPACLIKEQFLAVLIAMLAFELFNGSSARQPDKKKILIISASIVLDITANFWARQHLFPAAGSSLLTLLWFAYQRLRHPLSFVRYVAAWFTAYGAFGLLPFYFFSGMRKEILRLHVYRLVALLALEFMAFGLLAGQDMDRILWSGFPFLMPIMLLATRNLSRKYVLAIFLLTVPLMHLASAIPQPSAMLPDNNTHGLFSWMMEYAAPGIVALWLLYMGALWIAMGKLRFLNDVTAPGAESSMRLR